MSTENNVANQVYYLNVMQALVEEKVDKCMEMANTCRCQRCRIDIIALTLSNLPSKYVVVHSEDTVPMLSIYEGRYGAMVLSQLMAACEKVKAHPRHDAQGENRGIPFCRD